MVDATRNVRTRFIGEDRTAAAARSASRNLTTVGNSYNTLQRTVQRTNQAIAAVTLGIAGGSVVRTSAELQNQTTRLSLVTRNLAKDQVFASRVAQNYSTDLQSITNIIQRLRVLQNAGALPTGQVEDFTTGLADLFAAFGADSARQENVLYGLAQALGQGTVQAQELNQVIEPLPGLLNELAKGAGVTAYEYRQLVKNGELLSTEFGADLLAVFERFEGSAVAASKNIQQTLTRLSNAYKEFSQELGAPLASGFESLNQIAIPALNFLAENMDGVVLATQILGLALAANFGSGQLAKITQYTAGVIASSKQRIASANAETEAYAQKAAREKVLIAKSIKDRQTLAVAEAKAALQETVSARAANDTLIAKAARVTQSKQIIALEREIASSQKTEAASVARANATSLESQQKLLKSRESLQAANLAVASTQAAQVKRAAELKATRLELTTVEKQLVTAQRAATSTQNASVRAQQALSAATAKSVEARKAEYAVRQQNARLGATLLGQEQALATATKARGASIATLVTANNAVLASTTRVTLAMRAQAVAAASLGLAVRGLSSAYALIGGPLGAITLGAIAVAGFAANARQAAQESVLGRLEQRLKDIAEEAEATRRGLKGASEATTLLADAAVEIGKLNKEAKALKETIEETPTGFFSNLFFGGASSAAIAQLQLTETERKAQEYKDAIQEVEDQEAALARANALQDFANNQSRQFQQASDSAKDYRDKILDAGVALANTFNTQPQKIAELRAEIGTIEDALNFTDGDKDATAALQAGLAEAQVELNKMTGETKRREEAENRVTKALEDQRELQLSVLNEEQKLIEQTKDKIDALRERANVVDFSGRQVISDEAVDSSITALIEQRNDKLIDLAEKRRDREITAAEKTKQELERIENEINDTVLKARNELLSATRTIDPVLAAQQALGYSLADLKARALEEVAVAENLEKLKLATVIEGQKNIAAARDAFNQKERQRAIESANNVSSIFGATNAVIEALRSDVGSYIDITSDMSDAERVAAEKSNALNKKRFERDKKLRTAQAIIDALAGANRALATQDYAGAIAALALGFANVRKIRATQFNSSAASSSTGGGSSLSSDSSSTSALDTNTTPVVVNFEINYDASLYSEEAVQKSVRTTISNDSAKRLLLVKGNRLVQNTEQAA